MITAVRRARLRFAVWLSELPARVWPCTGRHVARIGAEEVWLPPTPMPALAPLPPWEPRAPRYVPAPVLTSEWLSARYAELYQWVADMERCIYAVPVEVHYG